MQTAFSTASFTGRKARVGALLVACWIACSADAQLIDPLNNANNFTSGFNGTTATADGMGALTLTRTQSGIDAGIDWMNGGSVYLSMSSEGQVTITPTGTGGINGGKYNVGIIFFTAGGTYLTEKNWLPDTTSTAPQSVDVTQFAIDNGVSGSAANFFLRFRIDPQSYGGGNPAFSFDEISAVPEPATVVTSILALLYILYSARRGLRTKVTRWWRTVSTRVAIP